MIPRDPQPARDAFREGNLSASIEFHKKISDEPHKVNIKRNYTKYTETFVENASCGLFISCSILSGMGSFYGILQAFDPPKEEILVTILFFAVLMLFSVGFAIGYLDYINNKEYSAFYAQEKRRETWEYDNYIEGEQREMIELYVQKGIPRKEAENVINLLSSHRTFFIDMMMKEELELLPPNNYNFLLNGFVIMSSVVFVGLLPFLPYILFVFQKNWCEKMNLSSNMVPMFSLSLCFLLLFICGFSKSKFTVSEWWKLGWRMVVGGILVSGVGIYIGSLCQSLIL